MFIVWKLVFLQPQVQRKPNHRPCSVGWIYRYIYSYIYNMACGALPRGRSWKFTLEGNSFVIVSLTMIFPLFHCGFLAWIFQVFLTVLTIDWMWYPNLAAPSFFYFLIDKWAAVRRETVHCTANESAYSPPSWTLLKTSNIIYLPYFLNLS